MRSLENRRRKRVEVPMLTPALAVGWSIWRRHRALNMAVLAMVPLCATLYHILQRLIPERLGTARNFVAELPLTVLPMAASMVYALFISAQTDSDPRRGFTGLPSRLFVLPVRTGFLVGCHMIYGVAAVVGLHAAWALLVFAPLGVRLELPWPLALSAAGVMIFQAAVWGLVSFPWWRAVVVGLCG